MVREKLSHKRVLLVLDDVDNENQLQALAGDTNWFGQGSRIIVTTRDKSVLNLYGVGKKLSIFHPDVLSEVDSIKLLSLHAFGEGIPPEEYNDLIKKVVKRFGGIPLALEVTGSKLSGCSMREWPEMLHSLDVVPHDIVHSTLMISFNGLDDEEKSIFLLIACNFLGKKYRYVIYYLEGLGFSRPILAIKVLERKFLLQIDKSGYFNMHDLLRDMAKLIVREQRPKFTSFSQQQCRKQRFLALNKSKLASHANDPSGLSTIPLAETSFLSVDQSMSMKSLKHLPKDLKWLEWRNGPMSELPKEWDLTGVSVLDLTCSYNLKRLRPVLKNLRVLDLTDCCNLKVLPNFAGMRSLSELILHAELKSLPDDVCELSNLKVLDLSYCEDIGNLPENIGNLVSLEELCLNHTGIRSLPQSFGCLRKLLRLSVMSYFETFYELFYLRDLQELELGDLPNWEGWQENLNESQSPQDLKRLVIYACPKLKLLPYFPKLEVLIIRQCVSLEVLPYVDTLKEVDIFACEGLRTLWKGKTHGSSSNLKILKLQKCPSLELKWQDLTSLTMLSDLLMPLCASIVQLPTDDSDDAKEISKVLESLKMLKLIGEKLEGGECLPTWLQLLSELELLEMWGFRYVRHLAGPWQKLTQLKSLSIVDCPSIKPTVDNCMLSTISFSSKHMDNTHRSREY